MCIRKGLSNIALSLLGARSPFHKMGIWDLSARSWDSSEIKYVAKTAVLKMSSQLPSDQNL